MKNNNNRGPKKLCGTQVVVEVQQMERAHRAAKLNHHQQISSSCQSFAFLVNSWLAFTRWWAIGRQPHFRPGLSEMLALLLY